MILTRNVGFCEVKTIRAEYFIASGCADIIHFAGAEGLHSPIVLFAKN